MKRYGILQHIAGPSDLRDLSYESLGELCSTLREFIVDHVSQTGGHLASNLGVVELAVALEREFDSSLDRIIYDVGHQSYVHKILTGRRDQFDTLRQFGGISGFMRPAESACDPCVTGHASSSVSVALGMAHARTLKKQKYQVVAVIGDGALTGGMAYEALSSAGGSKEPLIVVLNDNKMSIARNVGGLSRHLARLRISPRYLNAKNSVKAALSHVPGGKALTGAISRGKARLKRFFLPASMFEQMGFVYLGPIDGHDLKSICEQLQQAKKMKKPVVVHVVTQKGKGYEPAESHPEQFHGVSSFDPITGEVKKSGGMDFSGCFGQELGDLAAKDGRICAVTAAMPSGTGLADFAVAYPDRFFDVGIAEEHAVAMAAGMAKQGLKPVCALYSTFLQRAYDQILHDIAIEGLNVVFAVDRAGVVGADGATHNGVFDVAFLRSVPGMKLYAPSNFDELRSMLNRALYRDSGPVAIRYPRGGEGAFVQNTAGHTGALIHPGQDALIVTYGAMVNAALQAATLLQQDHIACGVCKINELNAPLSQETIAQITSAPIVLVLEDVVQRGGLGETLAAAMTEQGLAPKKLILRNTGDRFLPHGSLPEVYQFCGLDAESLAAAIREGR